ncbi:hypothetical protein [Novipirellula rosea]|uniref:DUF3592 domain-containing protein n=1 Tax=Novipirellula rosea TaxID=1031540 RepID=A0ABP8MN83_9BACT
MNDEYFNVEVNEEFSYEGDKYRKLDDRRSLLLSDGDEKVVHFYPKDEVYRLSLPATEPILAKQKLPERSSIRNALLWVMLLSLGILVVGGLLSAIVWLAIRWG